MLFAKSYVNVSTEVLKIFYGVPSARLAFDPVFTNQW
jgi:hypothetical protein